MDRRKAGSKHHLVVEANGAPLAATPTGANRLGRRSLPHDVTQLVPLVEKIPPVDGKPGAPLSKPRGGEGRP